MHSAQNTWTVDTCPSPNLLDEYTEGNLKGRMLVEFRNHLSQCSPCAKTVKNLQQNQLFEDLKQARRQRIEAPKFDVSADTLDPGFSSSLHDLGYQVLGEISRGGQGIVYKAIQLQTNRIVAIKQLFGSAIESQSDIKRFKQEIELIASLDNPNIVTIFDGGKTSNSQYYVMEFVEGKPLGEFWNNEVEQYADPNKIPREKIRAALKIVRTICRAVKHLHQAGIIHRDLKPENILINSYNEPKILDLGLAKHFEKPTDKPLTRTGEFLGTLAYASPEQTMLDTNLVDTRSDVYSLGVILYEMVTQQLPFKVNDGLFEAVNRICKDEPLRPCQINQTIETDVETIILKSLAKDPERRYQSVEQLGKDIDLYLNNRPIEAMRDSRLYVARKILQRHKPIAILAALLVCTGLWSLGFSWYLWSDAVDQRDAARIAQANESEARQEAEIQAYIGNLVATRSLVLAKDVCEAKRRLKNTSQALQGWEYDYWLARTDASAETHRIHDLFIEDFHLFDQGQKVVSVAGADSLKVWSFTQPSEQIEVELSKRPSICCVSFDDATIGCVSGNKEVEFFDANDLTAKRQLRLKFNVLAAKFLRTGHLLTAGWDDDSNSWIAILDPSSDEISYHESEVKYPAAVSIHPHLSTAVVVGHTSALLDLETLEFQRLAVSGKASAAEFAPNGDQLAIGFDQEVALIDLATHLETRRLRGHEKTISDLAFSTSSQLIAASSVDGTIRSWNLENGTLESVFLGHDQRVSRIGFIDAKSQLLSSSYDGTFKKWSLGNLPNPSRHQFHERAVRDIQFSSDSKQIASVSEDSTCVIRNTVTGELVHHLQFDLSLFGVCYSPDGSTIAMCGDDNNVWLVSRKDGSRRSLPGHSDRVHTVRFDPDGKRLVSSSRDQTVIVWDVASGKILNKLQGHPSCVHAAIFDEHGERIVSRCHLQLKFWDAESGQLISKRDLRIGDEDYSLVLHPSGKYVGAGTSIPGFGRGFVSLIDLESFQPTGSLEQHNAPITSLDFSPDGKRSVSSSANSIKIWDVETKEEVTSLDGIEAEVTCVRFSPNGKLVAAGFRDGTVMIWNSKPNH